MSKEQQLMINSMNMLLRRFNKLSDNEVVTVREIIVPFQISVAIE